MANAKTVLIVDDHPHIVRSLGFVIRRAGYRVLEARGGREALGLIRKERPDLVFLDIMMPELDGYEVCRTVKGDPDLAATYIIMLTARGQESDHQRSIEVGANDYMTKPFSPSRAVQRVEWAVGPPD
jgi:DNA-binding response OmpR family regulator